MWISSSVKHFASVSQHQDKDQNGTTSVAFRPRSAKQAAQPLLVEIEVYLHLLTLIYLLDSKQMDKAVTCSKLLMARLLPLNRRSMDMLAAKCYFYHSRVYELITDLDSIRGSVSGFVDV